MQRAFKRREELVLNGKMLCVAKAKHHLGNGVGMQYGGMKEVRNQKNLGIVKGSDRK